MSDYDESNNILTIQTVQIAPFRTLMTALKDILPEANINFTQNGIELTNMDKSHTILANLVLHASKFERYVCLKEKIVIGVNIMNLFKVINTIDNNETLTIYIDSDDYSDGVVKYLGLKFDNEHIKQQKIHKLKLNDAEQEDFDFPPMYFSSVLNIPSSDFQKIVRDLSSISDIIEICSIVTNNSSELKFKARGDFAESEIIRSESDESMEYIKKQKTNEIIQGKFSLKNLSYFIKCTNLCNQIELFLENDKPLVVKYYVASLGEIKLCLTPLQNDNLN